VHQALCRVHSVHMSLTLNNAVPIIHDDAENRVENYRYRLKNPFV